jgi:CheY-like chemotaxis protein
MPVRRGARVTLFDGKPRPRVFLVDDHPHVLNAVSAMLFDDFDVVGAATDGARAVEAVRQANPDVIVLDVDMPGLTGFQTLRELERAGLPTTPVVFLSMHDANEIVHEAFRCGGRGYVVKSHVSRDLPSALEHALLGRLFVPSLPSLFELANGGGHALQLYRHVDPFLDGLAVFFDLALQRGDATCVISTKPVREGLAQRLRSRGWDVGDLFKDKRYLAVDAADALNRFMRNGLPDGDRLAEIAAELDAYRLAAVHGPASCLTIFGDMSALLMADGNAEGALALESQWNELTRNLLLLTLCGYPTSCLDDDAPNTWSGVCNEHWALSHAIDR